MLREGSWEPSFPAASRWDAHNNSHQEGRTSIASNIVAFRAPIPRGFLVGLLQSFLCLSCNVHSQYIDKLSGLHFHRLLNLVIL